MAENKTKQTDVNAMEHLASITDAARRADCAIIDKMMRRVTRHKPRMWGPTIIGYGRYHYTYASGHSGESCLAGFAPRKGDISIYFSPEYPDRDALLARLGKHKMGKACLYVRRLSDIDLGVLEEMVTASVAEIKRRYGEA